ncbi:hypothetical protein [Saccharothrix lopnurensis]|uniref:Uncharacterized protein n=1 Tax=Saccharothrix lopnurensis TaxID=1670621 RepID=A0ABW1PE04_9PSEU
MKQLSEELEHIDELCELVDELWPVPDRGSVLRIGGYCVEIGGRDAPWTQMASANLAKRRSTG